MHWYQLVAVVLSGTAVLAYVNHRVLKLPGPVGLMALSLIVSLVLTLLGHLGVRHPAEAFVASIDFGDFLLHGTLGYLLFAGALQVDFPAMRKHQLPVVLLATVGTLLSTPLIGVLSWAGLGAMGVEIGLLDALLLGALLSPTDPVAVLGIIRTMNTSKGVELTIVGESLLNDGVGVVVFSVLLGLQGGVGNWQALAERIGWLTLSEVGGGLLLGLVVGWLATAMLRSVDYHPLEIGITLAVATGGYTLADELHLSGPLAVVVAGLYIGSRGRHTAMSENTREHVDNFWELVDMTITAVLFVLIGIETLRAPFTWQFLLAGLLIVAVVLVSRWVSVLGALGLMWRGLEMPRRTTVLRASVVLTWCGLRGAIAIALALSLPHTSSKPAIVAVTYVVVVFSVLVQGLTIRPWVGAFLRWTRRAEAS